MPRKLKIYQSKNFERKRAYFKNNCKQFQFTSKL